MPATTSASHEGDDQREGGAQATGVGVGGVEVTVAWLVGHA